MGSTQQSLQTHNESGCNGENAWVRKVAGRGKGEGRIGTGMAGRVGKGVGGREGQATQPELGIQNVLQAHNRSTRRDKVWGRHGGGSKGKGEGEGTWAQPAQQQQVKKVRYSKSCKGTQGRWGRRWEGGRRGGVMG